MIIRKLTIGLYLLFVTSIIANGQIREGIFLVDKLGYECFNPDSANTKIEILKVMENTYVISYSYKYEKEWQNRRYYDELRTSYNDTLYYLTRIYPKCCSMGTYRETKNTKTICATKKGSVYSINIYNYYDKKYITPNLLAFRYHDEIEQKGKSKYMFPLLWTDTVYFYSNNQLYKKTIYTKGKKEERFYKKNGDEIELAAWDSLLIMPNFKNTTRTFEQNLRYFFSRNISYPQDAKDNNIDGKVYIRFIITKKGNIECVEEMYRIPILSDYCIEQVKSLPKLSPATKNGVPVNIYYVCVIPFHLD